MAWGATVRPSGSDHQHGKDAYIRDAGKGGQFPRHGRIDASSGTLQPSAGTVGASAALMQGLCHAHVGLALLSPLHAFSQIRYVAGRREEGPYREVQEARVTSIASSAGEELALQQCSLELLSVLRRI